MRFDQPGRARRSHTLMRITLIILALGVIALLFLRRAEGEPVRSIYQATLQEPKHCQQLSEHALRPLALALLADIQEAPAR